VIGLSLCGIWNLARPAQAVSSLVPLHQTRLLARRPLSPAADALGYPCWRSRREAGWSPIMILASGGIGMPALQAMPSRQVDDDHQGQLQGRSRLYQPNLRITPLIVTAIRPLASTWNGRLAWIVCRPYLVCPPRCVAVHGAGATRPEWKPAAPR